MPGRGGGPGPGMAQGAGETRSTGGKSWHWMLPFYTVGVIVFLLYTLSKVCILFKLALKDYTYSTLT